MTDTNKAVATTTATPGSVVSGGGLALAGGRTLAEMKGWLEELRAFVHSILVEGVDFGKVSGIPRPFLQKPGAEKLCLLYNLAPEFHPIESDTIRNWSAAPPHIQLAYRCDLIHRGTGVKVGEGSGVCSTWESKYRYRVEWRNNDDEIPPAGQGWKKAKTGYKRQTTNEDISDSINTVMKIAQKRAMIDAVLRTTATSEFFTQDIEDAAPAGADRADRGGDHDAGDDLQKRAAAAVKVIEAQTDFAKLEAYSVELAKEKAIGKHPLVRAAYKAAHHRLIPPEIAKAREEAKAAKEKAEAAAAAPSPEGKTTAEYAKAIADAKELARKKGAADAEGFEDPGPPE